MKKIIVSMFLLLSALSINGQDTITSYYNRNWDKCSKELAVYYRKSYPDSSGMWIVRDYYMSGQLQMSGQCSDKKLKKQQGLATFYHSNGNLYLLGHYSDNKKVGIWKHFNMLGNLSYEGKLVNGKRDSIWTFYHSNNSVFGIENYVNGKKDGESKWYYESGKISEIATYKKDKIINKINYDEDGNITKNAPKDCNPEFIGGHIGMVLFIKKHLKYPEELELKGKEGIVLFHFIVRKDGSIDNIEYMKSDEPLFNQEALRVFDLIKKMKPACAHGQIIDKECTLPINFRLH